jgi:hypothetical protein
MEFGNIVRVETSRYLTKITTLRRKADRCPQVLAAKHTASLQLLCTVGGDLAGPRTVAKYFFFSGGGGGGGEAGRAMHCNLTTT